jgi:hypothetical protein
MKTEALTMRWHLKKNALTGKCSNLSEWNLSEGIFQNWFWPNRNPSGWNHSEGVFQKENIFSKTGIFQLSECNLSERIVQNRFFGQTGIFLNGIIQKKSFRNDFLRQPLEHKVVSEK